MLVEVLSSQWPSHKDTTKEHQTMTKCS